MVTTIFSFEFYIVSPVIFVEDFIDVGIIRIVQVQFMQKLFSIARLEYSLLTYSHWLQTRLKFKLPILPPKLIKHYKIR